MKNTALIMIDLQNDCFPATYFYPYGAAFDKDDSCMLSHDACATRSLQFQGQSIDASQVYGSSMAALGGQVCTGRHSRGMSTDAGGPEPAIR